MSTPSTALATPLLQVRDLKKHYAAPKRWLAKAQPVVLAVDGVSFDLAHAETLALVGESGCAFASQRFRAA